MTIPEWMAVGGALVIVDLILAVLYKWGSW